MKIGRHRPGLLCLLGVMSFAMVGCSKGSDRGAVSGTVTLDGQPLTSGSVKFVPADGRTATADAMIQGGKYSAVAMPGEKRVEITSPKVIGKRRMMPESPEIDIVEELLPPKYNIKSELTYSVTTGSQTKNFELQSK